MMLWDGSRHDWLEGRGPYLCLMGAVDDATGCGAGERPLSLTEAAATCAGGDVPRCDTSVAAIGESP